MKTPREKLDDILRISLNDSLVRAAAGFVDEEPKLVKRLVDLLLSEDYRIAQRAAGVLFYLAKRSGEIPGPHMKRLVAASEAEDAPRVVRRNVLRIFQFVDAPENVRSRLFSHCLDVIGDPHQDRAIRAFAMTAALRAAGSSDELKRELSLVIEMQLPHETAPSFVNHARRVVSRVGNL
jgi:hypothetical protein